MSRQNYLYELNILGRDLEPKPTEDELMAIPPHDLMRHAFGNSAYTRNRRRRHLIDLINRDVG